MDQLRDAEDIVDGFEQMPSALIRLFEGANLGKQLVRASKKALFKVAFHCFPAQQ